MTFNLNVEPTCALLNNTRQDANMLSWTQTKDKCYKECENSCSSAVADVVVVVVVVV